METPAGVVASMAGMTLRFEPIALEDVGRAELPHRYDTKFAVPEGALANLLERCLGHYRILEVQGTRVAPYETVYFDTPALDLYHAHYERRFPRVKVRVRTYLDSEEAHELSAAFGARRKPDPDKFGH